MHAYQEKSSIEKSGASISAPTATRGGFWWVNSLLMGSHLTSLEEALAQAQKGHDPDGSQIYRFLLDRGVKLSEFNGQSHDEAQDIAAYAAFETHQRFSAKRWQADANEIRAYFRTCIRSKMVDLVCSPTRRISNRLSALAKDPEFCKSVSIETRDGSALWALQNDRGGAELTLAEAEGVDMEAFFHAPTGLNGESPREYGDTPRVTYRLLTWLHRPIWREALVALLLRLIPMRALTVSLDLIDPPEVDHPLVLGRPVLESVRKLPLRMKASLLLMLYHDELHVLYDNARPLEPLLVVDLERLCQEDEVTVHRMRWEDSAIAKRLSIAVQNLHVLRRRARLEMARSAVRKEI